MEQPLTSPSFIGIDVSKDRLDVHIRPSGQGFTVMRDGKGLDQLAIDLAAFFPVLIVLEATGGFEITVAAALAGVGLPLAVVNPRQIRDFARATAPTREDRCTRRLRHRFVRRTHPPPATSDRGWRQPNPG